MMAHIVPPVTTRSFALKKKSKNPYVGRSRKMDEKRKINASRKTSYHCKYFVKLKFSDVLKMKSIRLKLTSRKPKN